MNKNYYLYRNLSLSFTGILLIWFFFSYNISNYSFFKDIPKEYSNYFPLIIFILLLFSLFEIILEYTKIKKEDKKVQDHIQFYFTVVFCIASVMVIYPNIFEFTFLNETKRIDLLLFVCSGIIVAFLVSVLKYGIEMSTTFKRFRKTTNIPTALGNYFLATLIMCILFFNIYYSLSRSLIITSVNYIYLLFPFFIILFINNSFSKMFSSNALNDLEILSNSLDRAVEVSQEIDDELNFKNPAEQQKYAIGIHNKGMQSYLEKIGSLGTDPLIINSSEELDESGSHFGWNTQEYNVIYLYFLSGESDEALSIMLENKNLDINYQAENGYTLLNNVTANKNIEAMKILLAKAADANIPNKIGHTPLFIACNYGNTDSVRLLIEYGANVNYIASIEKLTPLMTASAHGYTEIVKLLIDSGANSTLLCRNNYSALDYAERNRHGKIAKLLRPLQ